MQGVMPGHPGQGIPVRCREIPKWPCLAEGRLPLRASRTELFLWRERQVELEAAEQVEVLSVSWATTMQQEIPPGRLSRVSSYDALGNYALMPVGPAIAGPLASAFGALAVLAAGGALVVILPIPVLLFPEVRQMRRR
jgi:hypothetical protein